MKIGRHVSLILPSRSVKLCELFHLRKEKGRERGDGTLGTFLPLLFYLNPSSFLHPSLRSQVLEVWSIDYMDPASWPRAVCTLCCPDNPLTLTIFVQHRHFFSSIIFFFFFSFDLSSIPALLATCSLITRIYPSLLSRVYIYISIHHFYKIIFQKY